MTPRGVKSSDLPTRLAEMVKLHKELNSLAKTALGLLEKNQLEALDDLWAKRRALSAKIGLLQKKLRPAFAQWAEALAGLSTKDAQVCVQRLDRYKALANQTLELDQRAVPLLERAKEDLRRQMQQLNAGKKLVRAYSRAPVTTRPMARFSRNG